jgi:CheY-like chemotaxis protein/HPt (histidine-containing phosphotransfer) domain-containing protein
LTPQQRLHVQIFRQSGQALHALINDLLDLSKIESGRLELLAEPFDLGACLEQLCHLMRPRAEDKGLSLHLRCAPGLPTRVVGDRLRLEQMLTNLLANAIKFTSRGEVTLRVSPEAEPARELRFEVIDTGIGIAPNKLERIFEPFAQADGHVAQAFGGTGLGLAITRNLASLMGGSVQVQSAPGRGSTFTLVLPLAAAPADASPAVDRALPAAAGAAAAPAQRPTAFARPLAVLLAEDNEINTYLFGAMLEGLPLTIEMAANGVIALEHLRRRGYDIAFLDVQMPGLDGLAVARELRALELRSGRARTPVVALTANAFASDVRAALDAGCDRHVPKPFSRALLVEAIAALVPASAAGFDQAHEAALPAAPDAPAALSGAAVRVDHDAALERMGGDPELHRRAIEHALVFLGHWLASFDQAVAEGSLRTAHRLAHDLKAVAGTLGAAQLVDHAAALEKSLYEPEPDTTPDAAALQRVRAVLPGVLAALAERHALR